MNMIKNSNLVFALGILASVVFWCLDALIDVYIFGDDDNSILESIFAPGTHEIYMRAIVLFLFVVVTIFSRSLILQQEMINHELEKHKNNLQGLVEMRTEQLEKLATIDDLTQIFNRRKFFELARYEIIRNDRHQHPLTVIMLDIDHFKQVNDTFGHATGDEVIQVLARTVSNVIRTTDIFGRIGGEEFSLILPETARQPAEELAERIRQCVEDTEFPHREKITISLGVAELNSDDNLSTVFNRADEALYKAKDSGRNKVVAA